MCGIDFRTLRREVRMAEVLRLLGFVPTHRRGPQLRGHCPVHGGHPPCRPTFSVHLEKNVYHCFQCGSSGTALDLWAATTRQPLWDAAVDLYRQLHRPVPWLSRW